MATKKKPYKLRIKQISWLSSVDTPAQGEGAKARLLKGSGGKSAQFTARVVKTNDALGLVFGHAFVTSLDGGKTPFVDLQDDAIDPDFLKAAMEFILDGGETDVNHDGSSDGRVVFAWPLLPDINKALGIESDKFGLAVAIRPSPETYQAFKRGELSGFSIEGVGIREPMDDDEDEDDDDASGDSPGLGDRDDAPAAAQVASKAARGAAGDEADDEIVRRMFSWLDEIAKRDGIDRALEVAVRNKHSMATRNSPGWGQRWIDERAEQVAKEQTSELSPADYLAKAETQLVRYVGTRAERAGVDYETMEAQLAERDDDTYVQLYKGYCEAQAIAAAAPTTEDLDDLARHTWDIDADTAARTVLDDGPVMDALDGVNKIVEERALAWNVTMGQAQERLEEINPPSYQAAKKRFEETYRDRFWHPT